MSTISRLKVWQNAEVLTHSDLNSEFNNIVNDYNGSVDMDNIDATIAPSWTGVHTFANHLDIADAIGIRDANSNEQLIFQTTGSAVNYFEITNSATGVRPTFASEGEADTGMILADSNTNEVVVLTSTASAINYVEITNAATGNPPEIGAATESVGLVIKAATPKYVDKGTQGGGTTDIDWSAGNTQKITLNGDETLTFSNPENFQRLVLIIVQDGSGSRLITWPGTVRWLNGTGATDSTTDAPTLTTTASKFDVISLYYDSDLSLYIGGVVGFTGAIT